MRKVIVSEFVSLDGVMEGPGPADPYEHAGWTMPYGNAETQRIKLDELFASDALLLGRVTYEGFAAAWPAIKDEAGFSDRMNGLPKYVVSTTLKDASWNNSHIIAGNVAEEVAKLKQQPGQDILVAGSSQLIQSLIEYNLVDEYTLLVYPVVLGSGKRLFKEGTNTTLKLIEAKPLGEVTLLRYQPAKTDSNAQ